MNVNTELYTVNMIIKIPVGEQNYNKANNIRQPSTCGLFRS